MTNRHNSSNPELSLPAQQEVNEWVDHFRTCSRLLDRCRSLSDAASRLLLRGQLARYAEEIEVPPDSALFRTMRLVGDRYADFKENEKGKFDPSLLQLGMLMLADDDDVERLHLIAQFETEGTWKAGVVQLTAIRRKRDSSYESGGISPNPED